MATVLIDSRDAHAPELRGWGRYTLELTRALVARAPQDGIGYAFAERGWDRLPEFVYEQVGLPREAKRRGAAVLHQPNCFLPLRRPCPGVVTIHDLAFETQPQDFAPLTGRKFRYFARAAAESADRVICVSDYTRDEVCSHYAVDPERTRVIGEGPSLPLGDAEPPPGPYLLAIGDLRGKKNLGRLVEAFRALHAEGLPHRLVLAGSDSGSGSYLAALAADAPVELTGYLSDSALDALLRGADMLIHPSILEGFGLVLVEAMLRGVPVACSNTTALPGTAGGAAELFDPLDPAAIATAIRNVTGDPQRRAELVAAGTTRAAELTWEHAAEQTAAVYKELL